MTQIILLRRSLEDVYNILSNKCQKDSNDDLVRFSNKNKPTNEFKLLMRYMYLAFEICNGRYFR